MGRAADDDGLIYTPTGPESARLTRDGSPQMLKLTSVGGDLTIDPLGGQDQLTVVATPAVDAITGTVDSIAVLAVNATKAVHMPTANVEQIRLELTDIVDSGGPEVGGTP